jgi:hypothetical protein
MDVMHDDRSFQINSTFLAQMHSLDIAAAARTSLPVLISAPTPFALPIAIEIAVGPGTKGADGLVVVDAADDEYLRSTLKRAASADFGRLSALVVYDVEALDWSQQSTLKALVTRMTRPGARACRLIATTSVPLFERVLQGSFDSDLFYCLNTIHITAGGSPAAYN